MDLGEHGNRSQRGRTEIDLGSMGIDLTNGNTFRREGRK